MIKFCIDIEVLLDLGVSKLICISFNFEDKNQFIIQYVR